MELPAGAARHVQVLRLQPGNAITLFNQGPGWDGPFPGGEFNATVTRMGRSNVEVEVGLHRPVERESPVTVHLAVGMPANDRMDWLVEKATELGAASIQPLMTERSVLRLSGERADKKVLHWQSVAIAACEQCGGNRVPRIHPVRTLAAWMSQPALRAGAQTYLLSLASGSLPLQAGEPGSRPVVFLSGPEGGLSASEEALALQAGFLASSLGPRVLRSETAALSALARLLSPA